MLILILKMDVTNRSKDLTKWLFRKGAALGDVETEWMSLSTAML